MSNPTTPCVDCGEPRKAPRSVWCPACRKRRDYARIRAWQLANPEKMRKRRRKWDAANPEKVRAKRRRGRAKNAERIRDRERRRWAEQKEDRREAFRRWRKQNPPDPAKRAEIARRWSRNHPDKVREHTRDRRALRAAAFVATVTVADIARLMERQRGRCPYCDRSIRDGYHVDHYVPLAKGGTHEPENVQLTCAACNQSKGAKLPEEFAQERGKLF